MRNWHLWVALAVLFFGGEYLDWRLDRARHDKIAQAAYDRGKVVGNGMGVCVAFKAVRTEHPEIFGDEALAKRADADCAAYLKAHGPGTKEAIPS